MHKPSSRVSLLALYKSYLFLFALTCSLTYSLASYFCCTFPAILSISKVCIFVAGAAATIWRAYLIEKAIILRTFNIVLFYRKLQIYQNYFIQMVPIHQFGPNYNLSVDLYASLQSSPSCYSISPLECLGLEKLFNINQLMLYWVY